MHSKTSMRFLLVFCLSVITFILLHHKNDGLYSMSTSSGNAEKIYQLMDYKENSEKLPAKEAISMEEYLRFYQLQPSLHYPCPGVTRPKPGEISWKKVYQHVRLKFENYPGKMLN